MNQNFKDILDENKEQLRILLGQTKDISRRTQIEAPTGISKMDKAILAHYAYFF